MSLSNEETVRLTHQRWFVIIASCLINLCLGSMYAWSVFSPPMAIHLNALNGLTGAAALSGASLAIVFAVANIVGPVMTLVGGYLYDRFGPNKMIFIGGLIFGSAMLLSGFATSLTMLTLFYSVGIGTGTGFTYICTISNSVKLFPDKRGLIGGIITASYGLSSVIMPPIAIVLINTVGVVSAFKCIGLAFIVIICGCSFLIKKCPAGFAPAGWTPPATSAAGASRGTADKNWKQMLADPIFYVMLLMLTSGAVFGLMIISQASSLSQNMIGMSVAAATSVVSILALFNAAGRVSAGFVSDKIGRVNTLALMLMIAIFGLGLLYFSGKGDVVLFYIGVSIVGMCFGSFMGVYPGFTADQFGAKYSGFNYGIMFIGFGLSGIIGPMLMTNVYKSSGNYQYAFLIAAVLALVGIVFTFIYRSMSKGKKLAALGELA
jgi:MFS transporter, OFA family, oxalate/formate antiporter